MAAYSKLLDSLAMNVSVWYPMNYFIDPDGVNQTVAMFKAMVGLDEVFVPAGDGSEVLAPLPMLAVIEEQAKYLALYHPSASSWVNAQQYSQENLTALMDALDEPVCRGLRIGVLYLIDVLRLRF